MSKKEAYLDKAQASLDEKAAKLNQLKAQAKGEVADTKIEAYDQIEKLETKIEAAKSHLSEIADSAEDKWEDLSGRFESLAEDIGSSFKKFFNK